MSRTVLVTGASGGIGVAVVRAAADRGYHVLAAGRHATRLDELCAGVPRATTVVVDLRDPTTLPPRLVELDRALLPALRRARGQVADAYVAELTVLPAPAPIDRLSRLAGRPVRLSLARCTRWAAGPLPTAGKRPASLTKPHLDRTWSAVHH